MTMFFILFLIFAGILGVGALWTVNSYNTLVHLKALADEGWSGINVQLKRRYDLIPNLVAIVKGYAIHEKEVLENVVRMRAVAMNATLPSDKIASEAGLTQALKTLFAVVENYPNLKANENFLSLQKDVSATEHEIQLARRYYNGSVRNYTVTTQTFPTTIIAAIFNFSKITYFELAHADEKENPKINF